MSYIKFKSTSAPSATPNTNEFIIFMASNGDLKYKDQTGNETLVGGTTLTQVVEAVTNNFTNPIVEEVSTTNIINSIANKTLNRGQLYKIPLGPHMMLVDAIASDRFNLNAALILKTPIYNNVLIFNEFYNYVVDDKITHNGAVYNCIVDTISQLPTNTTYWELVPFTNVDYYVDYLVNCKYNIESEYVFEISDKIGNVYSLSKKIFDLFNRSYEGISTIGNLHGSQFLIGSFMWGNENWFNNKINESIVYNNLVSHLYNNTLESGSAIFGNKVIATNVLGVALIDTYYAKIHDNTLVGSIPTSSITKSNSIISSIISNNLFGVDAISFIVDGYIDVYNRYPFGSSINDNRLNGGAISGNNIASYTSELIGSITSNRLDSYSKIEDNLVYGSYMGDNKVSEGCMISGNRIISSIGMSIIRAELAFNNLSGKENIIGSNLLFGGIIYYNNFIGQWGEIKSNTLIEGSTIESNTIDQGSYINNNELKGNSSILENLLNGSYCGIYRNTLRKSSDIYGNMLNGAYCGIHNCELGGDDIQDEFLDLNSSSNCYIGACILSAADGYIDNVVVKSANFGGLYANIIQTGGMSNIKIVGQAGWQGSSIQYSIVNSYWGGLSQLFSIGATTVIRGAYIYACAFNNCKNIGGILTVSLYMIEFSRTGLFLDFTILGDPYRQGGTFNLPNSQIGMDSMQQNSMLAYQKVDELTSSLTGFAYLNVGQFLVTTTEVFNSYTIGLDTTTGELLLPQSYRMFNDILLGVTNDLSTFATSFVTGIGEYTLTKLSYQQSFDFGASKSYIDRQKVKLRMGTITGGNYLQQFELGGGSVVLLKLNLNYLNNTATKATKVSSNLLSSNGVPCKLLYTTNTQEYVEFIQTKFGYSSNFWSVSGYFTDVETEKLNIANKAITGVESKSISKIGVASTIDNTPTNVLSLDLYYNIVDFNISLVGYSNTNERIYHNIKAVIVNDPTNLSLSTQILSLDSTGTCSMGASAWGYTYSIISASPSAHNTLLVDVIGVGEATIIWSAKVEGHGVSTTSGSFIGS